MAHITLLQSSTEVERVSYLDGEKRVSPENWGISIPWNLQAPLMSQMLNKGQLPHFFPVPSADRRNKCALIWETLTNLTELLNKFQVPPVQGVSQEIANQIVPPDSFTGLIDQYFIPQYSRSQISIAEQQRYFQILSDVLCFGKKCDKEVSRKLSGLLI